MIKKLAFYVLILMSVDSAPLSSSTSEEIFRRGKNLTEQELKEHIDSLQARVRENIKRLQIPFNRELKPEICRNERGLVTRIFVSTDDTLFALCVDRSQFDVGPRASVENQAELLSKKYFDRENGADYWEQAYMMYAIKRLKEGKTIEEAIEELTEIPVTSVPVNDGSFGCLLFDRSDVNIKFGEELTSFFDIACTKAGFEEQRRVISEYWKSQEME